MVEITDRLKRVTDNPRWAARGASFMAKLKATKAVWFPPEPVEAGTKTARSAKKTTTRGTKKATSAAKKTGSGTKKATTKAVGRKSS